MPFDAPAYANRISRLEALADEIYSEGLMLGVTFEKERMIDTYRESYYRHTYDIQHLTGEYYDFEKLSSRLLREAVMQKWNGANYSQRVWNNTEESNIPAPASLKGSTTKSKSLNESVTVIVMRITSSN